MRIEAWARCKGEGGGFAGKTHQNSRVRPPNRHSSNSSPTARLHKRFWASVRLALLRVRLTRCVMVPDQLGNEIRASSGTPSLLIVTRGCVDYALWTCQLAPPPLQLRHTRITTVGQAQPWRHMSDHRLGLDNLLPQLPFQRLGGALR